MLRQTSLVGIASAALVAVAGLPASAAVTAARVPVRSAGAPHLMRINSARIGPHALRNTAGAHLTYYGGRVVSNISVVQVLWGTGSVGTGAGQFASFVKNTASPSVATFYQAELNGPYVDWLTSEYNTNGGTNQKIGRGSFAAQYVITPSVASTTITDAQIQSELDAQITAHHLPAPTADGSGNNNTYYSIFFPHGDTITMGTATSCVAGGFYAYHGTIAAGGGVPEVYYGVQADMQAGSGCDVGLGIDAFGNETQVASHELVETLTDPEVGLAGPSLGPPLGWYDNANGEIGDICNGVSGTVIGSDGLSYTVQQEFSNTRSACALVGIAPNVTSATTTTFKTLTAGTFNVTTTGEPAPALSETGALPIGVTFVDNGDGTATLSGTAATSGTYPISLKATDGVLPNATQSFTLTIATSGTHLVYSGSLTGTYGDPVPVSATLTNALTLAPIASAAVVFTIGSQQVTLNTNSSGVASGTLPDLLQGAGAVTVSASFAGNSTYSTSSDVRSGAFTIGRKAVIVSRGVANPRVLAGVTRSGAFVMHATVREISDGSSGNIALVPSVTFRLVPIGGGVVSLCSTATPGNSIVTSGATRVATCTFGTGVPLGVYEVQIGLGANSYYAGGFVDTLVVANPAAPGSSGAGSLGTLAPGTTASFAFRTAAAGAPASGALVYVTTTTNPTTGAITQQVLVSGTVTRVTLYRTVKPFRAVFSGVGILDGVGGYAFAITAQDTLGTLNDADRFTMVVTRPLGRPVLPPGLAPHLALVVGDIRVR